jgi:hypothetical protein
MTRLIVVHYHWRMGGVRRVIEVGVPAVAAHDLWGIGEVVLVSAEAADDAWQREMRARIGGGVPVSFVVEPAFGYVSEWSGSIEQLPGAVREAAARMLAGAVEETVVLLENPAVGRNLLVARALADACRAAGAWLFCHHHDYFFDGRWERWPEIEACGFRRASDAMAAAFAMGAPVWHFAISDPEPRLLEPGVAPWDVERVCGNPAAIEDAEPATAWLRDRVRSDAPIWLFPCRLLRRKNIIEAVLLARLVDPHAIVVTTGGPSSPSEQAYATTLAQAAADGGWPLHLGILAGAGETSPGVAALMRASDSIVMTSLFEGCGLPGVEAQFLHLPVVARGEALGSQPHHAAAVYSELWIDRDLLDWPAELERQRTLFSRWRARLPRDAAEAIGDPWWWHADAPVPFSRLTSGGQIELLRDWHDESRHFGAFWLRNPWLGEVKNSSRERSNWAPDLVGSPPEAFAEYLWVCVGKLKRAASGATHRAAFRVPALSAERLAQRNHYPLLWSTEG